MAKAGNRFGDQIEMLAGMQRQGHARHPRQFPPPHATAVDYHIGRNMPRLAADLVIHPGNPATRFGHTHNLGMLEYLRAAHPRTFGQRHRDIRGVTLPVQRQMHRPHHIANFQMRIHRLGFQRRDFLHIHIKYPRHRRLPKQFLMPRRSQGHRYAANLPHPRFYAGFCCQLHIQIRRILRQPGHIGRSAQLPDQPCRMPSGAAGQLLAFQQHNIRPPRLCQMIRD